MMASNRHHLHHFAKSNVSDTRNTLQLFGQTDKLPSLIPTGNNLISTTVPVLITTLMIHYFGNNGTMLSIVAVVVAFLIIVLAEIVPKTADTICPECVAFPVSFIIKPPLQISASLVAVANAFAMGVPWLVRIDTRKTLEQRTSTEESRTLVLESGNLIPHKYHSILLDLFDLDAITMDDVMTPRVQVEPLDLLRPIEEVAQQLETCCHNKFPVFEQDSDQVIGILHVRKVLPPLEYTELTHDNFRSLPTESCFVPSGISVLRQLQHFRENRRRLGSTVDEYGDIPGLVMLEDTIEETTDEFTTTLPSAGKLAWDKEGTYLADVGTSLCDLNRRLDLSLLTDSPKTLNGLLLEKLEEIPETAVSVKIAGCVMDTVQTDSRPICTV